jgi:hypothetical protein
LTLTAASGADQFTPWIDTLSFDGLIFHVSITTAGGGITLFGQSTLLEAPADVAADGGDLIDYAGTPFVSPALTTTGRRSIALSSFVSLPRKMRARILFGGAAVTGLIYGELTKTGMV